MLSEIPDMRRFNGGEILLLLYGLSAEIFRDI